MSILWKRQLKVLILSVVADLPWLPLTLTSRGNASQDTSNCQDQRVGDDLVLIKRKVEGSVLEAELKDPQIQTPACMLKVYNLPFHYIILL